MPPAAMRVPHAYRGASFQELLDWQHKEYERDGRALIFNAGLRGRVSKIHGKPVVIAQKSAPDYNGIILHGPDKQAVAAVAALTDRPTAAAGNVIPVYFDAKTTTNTRIWRLDKRAEHQLEHLRRVAAFGGIAFFLVECQPRHTCYIRLVQPTIAWPKIDFAQATDLVQVREDPMGHYDWLAAILA